VGYFTNEGNPVLNAHPIIIPAGIEKEFISFQLYSAMIFLRII